MNGQVRRDERPSGCSVGAGRGNCVAGLLRKIGASDERRREGHLVNERRSSVGGECATRTAAPMQQQRPWQRTRERMKRIAESHADPKEREAARRWLENTDQQREEQDG